MVLAHVQKAAVSPHEKKRHGQHHRPTKHYVKTYWPYLPMLLLVLGGLLLNNRWASVSSHVLGASTLQTSTLLSDTNLQRASEAESALALNNQLSAAAQQKANDMAARNYWSHATPDGVQPWQFITASGYRYQSAGENLAYGFSKSDDVIAAWMNSPEHRANLLNQSFSDVGFGVAHSSNFQNKGPETIVVALYGTPASSNLQTQPTAVLGEHTTNQTVARIDILSGGRARLAIAGAIALILLLVILRLYHHGKLWRKYFVRGERFIIHHPVFDICVVALAVTCVLLMHTAGFTQ